jgi:hypothetical protein
MQNTKLELKYCERCGALRLRRLDSTDNYCESCAQVLNRQDSAVRILRRMRPSSRKRPRPSRSSSPLRIGVPA